MVDSLFLSLSQGATFRPKGANAIVLQQGSWCSTFSPVSAGTAMAFERLASAGDYEDCLTDTVVRTDGPAALVSFYYHLRHLSQLRLLRRSVHWNGDRVATLVPISPYFEYTSRSVARDRWFAISRFAYTRAENGETMLESPLSHARIFLHDWRAACLIHALRKPTRLDSLQSQIGDVPAKVAEQFITLLLNAEMVKEYDKPEAATESEEPALRSWEFHDLLFHSRSRSGRHDHAVGGTYRLADQIAPPPALKPVGSSSTALPIPDLEQRKREDPPFALVQEQRRSIREYDERPITVAQLGEFLYRVGRVTEKVAGDVETPRGPIRMEFARRPYPSGGALYELELYLCVQACEGVTAGLYRYAADIHHLEPVCGFTPAVKALLLGASHATGIPSGQLQVMIIVAARFQRLAWKYSSIAYSAMLKDVGVLYQTMYLAATAMGLAPCGVGGGDSDLFARAASTDYYNETSVGEFLLGRRCGDDSVRAR